MPRPRSPETIVTTSVRLPASLMRRIDARTKRLMELTPGVNITRADVIRNLLSQAILEDDEDEARWQASFRASLPELEVLAKEALEEHKKRKTKPLNPDAI